MQSSARSTLLTVYHFVWQNGITRLEIFGYHLSPSILEGHIYEIY
jgi:hypothetical protein